METKDEKKERLLAALDAGLTMIHVDARRPGVAVPPHLKEQNHLRLNLSYRFDPPDLSVGDWGVRATLSFAGKRFAVAVPWSALFAITSQVTQEFWMSPSDMPPELMQKAMEAEAAAAAQESKAPKPKLQLQEVPPPSEEAPDASQAEGRIEGTDEAVSEAAAPPTPEPDAKPKSRSHLRLVK